MKQIKERSVKRAAVRQEGAPRAIALEYYSLWNEADILAALGQSSPQLNRAEITTEDVTYLNEILSDYLWSATPGTQDREGLVRRHNWFVELAETARNLRRLLTPVDDSALLLSGVGQPLLWMTTVARPNLTFLDLRSVILRVSRDCDLIIRASEAGREKLSRDLLITQTTIEGWVEVSDQRRPGRPSIDHWNALADELFSFWQRATQKEASVTVNPGTSPPTRSSRAARFVALLLDVAAKRLPPEKSWALAQLRDQERRLIAFLAARGRPVRRKRGKSSSG